VLPDLRCLLPPWTGRLIRLVVFSPFLLNALDRVLCVHRVLCAREVSRVHGSIRVHGSCLAKGTNRDHGSVARHSRNKGLGGECRARYLDCQANPASGTYRARRGRQRLRGESTGFFPTRTLRTTPLRGVPAWSLVVGKMKSLKALTSSAPKSRTFSDSSPGEKLRGFVFGI
jgi:hypothetical protein